jgi:hypothetical protein
MRRENLNEGENAGLSFGIIGIIALICLAIYFVFFAQYSCPKFLMGNGCIIFDKDVKKSLPGWYKDVGHKSNGAGFRGKLGNPLYEPFRGI